jgi:preprotein translocase subunit SecG
MVTFLYVLYVIVCVFLILVVLLQAGRGGMGSAFGGGSQTVFGGSGAGNFLTRLTVIMAAMFMVLSASLTYVSSSGEQSLERAEKLLREKEEARKAATKDKAGKATKAPEPAEQSTPESAPVPGEQAPVEGAEGTGVGPAVDDALKALDEKPAEGAPVPAAPAP